MTKLSHCFGSTEATDDCNNVVYLLLFRVCQKKEGLFNSSNNRRGGGFLSRSSEQCNLFFVTDFTSSITLRHATKLYTVTH